METPTFRPRPHGGEASPAGPDAPAFRPRPRGEQAGSPSPAATPERRGNLLGRIFGGHRGKRQPAREPASPLDGVRLDRATRAILDNSRYEQHTRENPFAGMFRGAISGVKDNLGRAAGGLIGLKDRLPSVSPEAGQRMTEQFTQRASHTLAFGRPVLEFIAGTGKSLWQSKTEIALGAATGAVIKEAAKFAASHLLAAEPSTLLARAGIGALGGAGVAGLKEWRRQDKEYRQFASNLSQESGINLSIDNLARKFDVLVAQYRAESDGKKSELLSDQLRYTAVMLKKGRWATEAGKETSLSKKQVLDSFLTSLERVGGVERYNEGYKQAIRRRIEQASSIQLGRLGRRALRGAAFGAAGAIAGGILVDWLSSHLEAAPMPAAATPTETPTATVEPPKPTATVVPAESTPAVPRPPAIAPDVQAAAPPEPPPAPEVKPQPPAAAPQPASPDASLGGPAAPAPTEAESLPPTTAPTGVEVQGSTVDNSLTYGGRPWVIVDNGVKNIGNLFKAVGESGDIDKQALASNLQNATKLWTAGQLNYTDHPDLYRIFHLSNGTSSLYNNLLQNDTLESLKKLGIVIRK